MPAKLTFRDRLEIEDLTFTYEGVHRPALQGVTLTINRGESLGLVGPSGAGKSTLVDLLLGLLPPEAGSIRVDGKDITQDLHSWREHIAYVPQAISLLDDTLRNNVAFGVDPAHIDDARVWRALEQAQMAAFCRTLPRELDTFVGERGARLSGGQRQRIGIARAMYLQSEIVVLDEATSSLDNESERVISSAIADLHGHKTVITIAHRLNTVQHCDRLAFMRDGKVVSVGSFAELLDNCEDFRRMVQAAELANHTSGKQL